MAQIKNVDLMTGDSKLGFLRRMEGAITVLQGQCMQRTVEASTGGASAEKDTPT